MNKYDYMHGLIETKLGTINKTFKENVFPLTYLTYVEDQTEDVIGLEYGISKTYERKARFYLYYQNQFANDTDSEHTFKTTLYDISDELEIKLLTGSFTGVYSHVVSAVERYKIDVNSLIVINNQSVVSGNKGYIILELIVNYNQIFN